MTIGEVSKSNWIYRRDPSVQRPGMAVLRTTDGIPYQAPELQLLFKSKGLRPKDDVDPAEAIPTLDARQRDYSSATSKPTTPGSGYSPDAKQAFGGTREGQAGKS